MTTATKTDQKATVRLTKDDQRIMAALCKKLGGSITSVFRQAIRVLATKEGVSA
jgi:hypothetical protein